MINIVSAVYIVKNEQENIENSIKSIINAVDNIIIIDTGSTDNTINICKKYQCEIHNFNWNGNFSDARNYAMSFIKSDYFFFLDADEYFEREINKTDVELIIEEIEKHGADGARFTTNNFDIINGVSLYNSYNIKFLKYSDKLKYFRKVHEIIKKDNSSITTILYNGINIVHTGYSSNLSLDKAKRNLDILENTENLETMDYFYLARENLATENIENAEIYCDLFFNQKDYMDIINKSDIAYLIYSYKYYIMEKRNCSYIEKRIFVDKMLNEIPDISQAYYIQGVLEEDNDYDLAYKSFMKCIEMEIEPKFNYINMFNIYEPDIYYRLSILDSIYGEKSRAIRRAMVSCMLDKTNILYLTNLLGLLKNKDDNYIIDMIYNIYRPSITSQFEFIVKALSNTNLNSVLLYFIREYNIKHNGGNKLVYLGMILSKEYEKVIDSALSIYENSGNLENQFMATLSVICSKNIDLFNKNKYRFEKSYQNIIEYYFGISDKLTEEEMHEYVNIYIRMHLLKIDFMGNLSLEYITDEDLINILNAYETAKDYKNVILVSNSALSYGNKFDNCKTEICKKLIFSLVITRKYKEVILLNQKYSEYIPENCTSILRKAGALNA